jgi:hypothetical protein
MFLALLEQILLPMALDTCCMSVHGQPAGNGILNVVFLRALCLTQFLESLFHLMDASS